MARNLRSRTRPREEDLVATMEAEEDDFEEVFDPQVGSMLAEGKLKLHPALSHRQKL